MSKRPLSSNATHWHKRRSGQGTGVNRAALIPGHISQGQCDRARLIVAGNAKDTADARAILESLGLIEPTPSADTGEDASC